MSDHDHVHSMTGCRLQLAFAVTLVILLVEAGAGCPQHIHRHQD